MTSINPVQDNRATMSKLFRFPDVCVTLYMHQASGDQANCSGIDTKQACIDHPTGSKYIKVIT